MKAKISIVVPVYNVKPFLPRCIDSILNQTLRDFQIILIDDGSTDGSGELCEAFAAENERICVVHQENQGQGAARNAGLDLAVGEYLGFVDSDDYIECDMCQKMYEAAVRTDADMVLAGMQQIGGNLFSKKDQVKRICCFEQEEIFSGVEGRKKLMLGTVGALPQEPEDSRYNFSVCKNLYRREIIKEYNLRFPEKREIPSEDVWFELDFLSHIRLAVGVPGAYYCYCRNTESTTRKKASDPYGKYKFLMNGLNEKLSHSMEEKEYRIFTDRMFQARARTAIVQEIQAGAEDHRAMMKRLNAILRDDELRQVLRRYPWWKLPVRQALFAAGMRYSLAEVLYWLVKLKERG